MRDHIPQLSPGPAAPLSQRQGRQTRPAVTNPARGADHRLSGAPTIITKGTGHRPTSSRGTCQDYKINQGRQPRLSKWGFQNDQGGAYQDHPWGACLSSRSGCFGNKSKEPFWHFTTLGNSLLPSYRETSASIGAMEVLVPAILESYDRRTD